MLSKSEHNRAFVVAAIIATVLSLVFVVPYAINAGAAKNENVLDQKINPNTASPQALAMIDGIGSAKAKNIIEYRRNSEIVFRDANDLVNVSGIGPKTIEKIRDKLKFE